MLQLHTSSTKSGNYGLTLCMLALYSHKVITRFILLRWQNTVQEIKDENIKTEETLLVWQEYTRLSCSCSAQQKHLQHEWEELSRSSLSAGHNTQPIVCSLKVSLGLLLDFVYTEQLVSRNQLPHTLM